MGHCSSTARHCEERSNLYIGHSTNPYLVDERKAAVQGYISYRLIDLHSLEIASFLAMTAGE
jgi:hypothetical protein